MTNIYLSGRFTVNAAIEKAWLKRSGCKYRCFSFAVVNPEKIKGMPTSAKVVEALKVCETKKVKIMMDSGAYSLHVFQRAQAKRTANAKVKQAIDINALQQQMFDGYVKYCLANKDKWEFYVTLDFKTDQNIIMDMQKKFLAKGLEPTPVYHGDSDIDWLRKHKDMGHSFICIGGARLHPGKHGLRYYFDKVFNYGAKHNLEYHGLAFTSLDIITSYPFKSVDSSTWSQTAAYGMVLLPDFRRGKFLNFHVSSRRSSNKNTHHDMSKKQKDYMIELFKQHGFDLKAMHDSEVERHDWNGYLMSNLDKFGVKLDIKNTWENLL